MALQAPFRLLEINIISAQDLPPVSKMLRTFAVAYVHPDHKLTTRIDHQGHTNPTWNYKVVFHVDEKFLKQESSAVTIEIYNLAWLRDLPIGTTRLLVNHLSPPLKKNPAFRRVALQICRPSGHLQGTLHVGVQLIDNTVPGAEMSPLSSIPGAGMSPFSIRNENVAGIGMSPLSSIPGAGMSPFLIRNENTVPGAGMSPFLIRNENTVPGAGRSPFSIRNDNSVPGARMSPFSIRHDNSIPGAEMSPFSLRNDNSVAGTEMSPFSIRNENIVPGAGMSPFSIRNDNSVLGAEMSPFSIKNDNNVPGAGLSPFSIRDENTGAGAGMSPFSIRNGDSIPGFEMSPLSMRKNYMDAEDQVQVKGPVREEYKEKIPGLKITSKNENICATPESRTTIRPESELQNALATPSSSMFSVMQPLPSEVAAELKKGFYVTEWNDYGSSIFDEWTEAGDKSEDNVQKPKIPEWPAPPPEDQIPLTTEKKLVPSRPRRTDKKTGLMSCFGNAYGFECSFFCGSKNLKKKKTKSRNVSKQNVHFMTLPEENMRGFYI
ncbi:hypothetical protein Salat_1075900 [Sesamum alatum]|uniref:C2 domain-containing protein n=1 Tax=Sesamum alatum TaxID=300844 RepID=A0AAE1YN73_9LAMI|nr:hypothetical protein Salat_1075900 [Sesamum alatum]